MALIRCPECGREVSNQAPACIHCGYPLQGSMEPPVWEEKQEASEVVIRMPKYDWARNSNVVVNVTLDEAFVANMRPSETVSVPVEWDSELVVRCGGAVVGYPIKTGKRTVIDVAINSFGVVTLSEEGADPSEARKSNNPMWLVLAVARIVLAVAIGLLLLLAFIKVMFS